MSAKGWREPNQRFNIGVSVGMVRAFGFVHSVDVVVAKIMVRLIRPCFARMVQNMRKKKDKRAIKLMRTSIFKRLEQNVRSGLNARKAFIRWDTFSRKSLVQYCAEKIPINSRINHMIALYRLLRVARQTKVKTRRYEEHTEFFETIIR